jgi:hypothetical protein
MGNKPPKKVHTSDACIDAAQQKLNIRYPDVIRDKLKANNGFYLAGLYFFPVFDPEDKFHTFDCIVRENQNPSGWSHFLPEGYVAIANEDHLILALREGDDTTVYFIDHQLGEIVEEISPDELENWLERQEKKIQKIYRET